MAGPFWRSTRFGLGRPTGRGAMGGAGRPGIGEAGRKPGAPAGRALTGCGERGSGEPATAWGLVGGGPTGRGGVMGRGGAVGRPGPPMPGAAGRPALGAAPPT